MVQPVLSRRAGRGREDQQGRLTRAAAILALLLGAPVANAAGMPSCPKSIEVAETPGAVPPGFTAFANGNRPTENLASVTMRDLNNIQFSDGPPNEITWLAPDNEEWTFQTWRFAPSPGKQTWFTCGYSDTRLVLSAPLPADIKSCRVNRDPSVQGFPATGMSCK